MPMIFLLFNIIKKKPMKATEARKRRNRKFHSKGEKKEKDRVRAATVVLLKDIKRISVRG
jgi:hypothetical protein